MRVQNWWKRTISWPYIDLSQQVVWKWQTHRRINQRQVSHTTIMWRRFAAGKLMSMCLWAIFYERLFFRHFVQTKSCRVERKIIHAPRTNPPQEISRHSTENTKGQVSEESGKKCLFRRCLCVYFGISTFEWKLWFRQTRRAPCRFGAVRQWRKWHGPSKPLTSTHMAYPNPNTHLSTPR